MFIIYVHLSGDADLDNYNWYTDSMGEIMNGYIGVTDALVYYQSKSEKEYGQELTYIVSGCALNFICMIIFFQISRRIIQCL